LEERIGGTLATLADAVQGQSGVLVIEAGVLSQRVGLEEVVARMPSGIGKVVVAGKGSVVGQELKFRNPNLLLVDSDDPVDWAVILAGLEEAGRITFLGDRDKAQFLSQILPSSMVVTPIDPKAGLEQILLVLGIPQGILDQVNAAGLEEEFVRLHAA